MTRWFRQFRLELSLLFRNWFLLPLPVLFGLWVVSELRNMHPDQSQDLFMYAHQFHRVEHTLSLGVTMLLGILLIRKDLKRTSYEWSGTLPLSGVTILTAKFMAGLFYMSLFTIAMSISYTIIAKQQLLDGVTILRHLAIFGVQYEWSYAVTLVLAMALAMFIPNRVVFLIGFCAWMFGTFFMDIFIISGNGLYFLKTFHLNQFFLGSSILENEAWGQGLLAKEMSLSRLFVFSFMILLMTTMIAYYAKQRPVSSYRRWFIGSIAAIALCAAAYVPYGLFWAERYKAFQDRLDTAPSYEQITDHHSFTTFEVDRYDIQVVKQNNDQLKITAKMIVPTSAMLSSDQLAMTLNRTFKLDSVHLNGEKISAIRWNDYVHIPTERAQRDQAQQELVFEYSGRLLMWEYDASERFVAFAERGNIWMPDGAAWFPLPTNEPFALKYIDVLFTRGYMRFLSPVEIRMEFINFGVPLYSILSGRTLGHPYDYMDPDVTIFEGVTKGGVFVLGGDPIIEVKVPNEELTVITTPSNRREAEQYIRDVSDLRKAFADWIDGDLSAIKRVVYIPLESAGIDRTTQFSGEAYFISASKHHNLDRYQKKKTINAMLFHDLNDYFFSSDTEDLSLVGEVRNLFSYVLYLEFLQNGRKDLASLLYSSTYMSDQGKELAAMVEQAMKDGKAKQVKEVLNTFYRRGLQIEVSTKHIHYQIITKEDWLQEWSRVMGEGQS